MLPGFHHIDIAPTRSSRNCIGDSPAPSVVASSETISTGPALTQTRTNCSARFCCPGRSQEAAQQFATLLRRHSNRARSLLGTARAAAANNGDP